MRLSSHYLASHAICCHTPMTLYVASKVQYVLYESADQLYTATRKLISYLTHWLML